MTQILASRAWLWLAACFGRLCETPNPLDKRTEVETRSVLGQQRGCPASIAMQASGRSILDARATGSNAVSFLLMPDGREDKRCRRAELD